MKSVAKKISELGKKKFRKRLEGSVITASPQNSGSKILILRSGNHIGFYKKNMTPISDLDIFANGLYEYVLDKYIPMCHKFAPGLIYEITFNYGSSRTHLSSIRDNDKHGEYISAWGVLTTEAKRLECDTYSVPYVGKLSAHEIDIILDKPTEFFNIGRHQFKHRWCDKILFTTGNSHLNFRIDRGTSPKRSKGAGDAYHILVKRLISNIDPDNIGITSHMNTELGIADLMVNAIKYNMDAINRKSSVPISTLNFPESISNRYFSKFNQDKEEICHRLEGDEWLWFRMLANLILSNGYKNNRFLTDADRSSLNTLRSSICRRACYDMTNEIYKS